MTARDGARAALMADGSLVGAVPAGALRRVVSRATARHQPPPCEAASECCTGAQTTFGQQFALYEAPMGTQGIVLTPTAARRAAPTCSR